MEVDSDATTLKNYINRYSGNSRFMRLLVIADKQERLKVEALRLCLTMAKAEKKIG